MKKSFICVVLILAAFSGFCKEKATDLELNASFLKVTDTVDLNGIDYEYDLPCFDMGLGYTRMFNDFAGLRILADVYFPAEIKGKNTDTGISATNSRDDYAIIFGGTALLGFAWRPINELSYPHWNITLCPGLAFNLFSSKISYRVYDNYYNNNIYYGYSTYRYDSVRTDFMFGLGLDSAMNFFFADTNFYISLGFRFDYYFAGRSSSRIEVDGGERNTDYYSIKKAYDIQPKVCLGVNL